MEQPGIDDNVRQIGELLDRRRTVRARELLSAAITGHPDDSRLLLLAARADMQDGRRDSARVTLARVLAQEPQHIGARFLMLALLIEARELPDAETLALALIRDFPNSAYLYGSYARIMLAALQLTKARALATEALRLEPDNEMALRSLALCDIVERPHSADATALHRLLAEHPEEQDTLALMVTALVHRRQPKQALRGAQELLRMQPDNAHWVSLVRELRYANHWSLKPLWPMQRFGWGGSIGLWVIFIVLSQSVAKWAPGTAPWLGPVIVLYVVYSWVWPPILRRLLR